MDSTIFATAREVEQLGGPVVRLYQIALGRPPDPIGLRSFVAMLRGGSPPAGIAEVLAGSPEFAARHGAGGADLAYVRRLYLAATGVMPLDTDIAGLLALAASGASRAELLLAMAGSEVARGAIDLMGAIGPARARPDDEAAYQLWLAVYPDLSDADRAGIAAHIAAMTDPPLLTLLMAAPHHRADLALETIASIRDQSYPHVELRVAVPADATPATGDTLARAARGAPWVVLVPAAAGSGPAALIEAAFADSTGAYAGVLEAGDQLMPAALYLMAAAIGAEPGAVVLYGDEDRIDGNGRRYMPRFKTGWNPDLMLAGDPIGQLAMIRAEAWREAGGQCAEAAPFERTDLVLRVLGASGRATHIPRVLFHRGRGGRRRPPDFPDACATSLHPKLLEVVRRAHGRLDPARRGASLDEAILGGRLWPRLAFPVPDPAPLVSVIIPTRDRADLLRTCLTGLLEGTDYPRLEVLIVDNGSTEPATGALFAHYARDPRVRVLPYPEEFNYSAMNNRAAREARGEVLLLLNNDIEVIGPGWLREMVGHAVRPDVGAVGAKLLYPDGSLQHGGMMLGPNGAATHVLRWASREATGYLGQLALTRDLGAVTGACMAIRRAVFEEVGGLEQDHLRVTWNDVDLCLRVRARGYRVVWTPHAVLTHVELATRGRENQSVETQERFEAEREYLLSHWGAAFDADPFHNPNLMATDDDLQLARPPRRPKPWLDRPGTSAGEG